MGDLKLLAVAVFWPGYFIGGNHGWMLVLFWPRGFSTHVEQRFQFQPEIVIEPAVNEGVVTGAAHCKPVKSKV